jgi:hypothetical protein
MNSNSVTFLYPSRKVGGAQYLFLRMARELSRMPKTTVSYIDYADEGFVAEQLSGDSSIKLIDYVQGRTPLSNTVVITSTFHLPFLEMMLGKSVFDSKNNVTFIFWTIHPENARLSLFYGGRRLLPNQSLRKSIFQTLADRKNIIFMDGANLASFEKTVGQVSDPVIIPIPVGAAQPRLCPPARSDDFRICWLGRLDGDKRYAVEKIIRDISILPKFSHIQLNIIGGGTHAADIEKLADSLNVRLNMLGYLHGDDLHTVLKEQIQLGIAMGTSCLEIASLGIPAALVDFSFDPLPKDLNYDWIFDTTDYDVGRQADLNKPRKNTLSDLIALADDQKTADQCLDYVTRTHNITAIANHLHEHIKYIAQQGPDSEMLVFSRILLPKVYTMTLSILRSLKHLAKKLRGA